MYRILYISAHLPDKVGHQAGHKTAYDNLLRLSAEGVVDVAIINSTTINNNSILDINCANILYFNVGAWRYIWAMISILFFVPPRFSTRFSFAAYFGIQSLLRANRYDKVFFEFSQVFPYEKIVPLKVIKVFSVHDLQYQLVSRKRFFERLFFCKITEIYERHLFKKADTVQCQSQADCNIIKSSIGIPEHKIVLSKPVLSSFLHHVKRDVSKIVPHSMIFWGAMNRVENSKAILWFVKTCFPTIQDVYPDAKLFIVGSSPPPEVSRIASPSIIVTGFLEDPAEYFVKASIGIAPLREGAGIKVKVLEMLECGLHVVASDVGAEGIMATPMLHISNLSDFPREIFNVWNR